MARTLESRIVDHVREHALMRAGDRVAVAVSGGADSVALLRLLLEIRSELGIVVSVAHYNHGIRGEASDADERFVRELAARSGVEFIVSRGDAPTHAISQKLSLETAARDLRYAFFRSLVERGTVNKVATAHTLDDQAETVLLRMIRGTGSLGLAGIFPLVAVAGGAIVRPLLAVRRAEVEEYLRSVGQAWCEDATNADLQHTRNRVRHTLLPLLEREFNPSVRERLAGMAEIAREEEAYWEAQISAVLDRHAEASSGGSEDWLDRRYIANQPVAVQRRMIRSVAGKLGITLGFEHIEAVRSLLDPRGPENAELPGGWFATRHSEPCGSSSPPSKIRFSRVAGKAKTADSGYEYVLTVPGEVRVPELGTIVRARLLEAVPAALSDRTKAGNTGSFATESGYTFSQPLDLARLTQPILVRNWRPGDRFWPSRSRAPKKVKELLQQKHISGPQRALWPVIVSGDQIVWMRGFPVPDDFRAVPGAVGVVIEEVESANPTAENSQSAR